MKLMCFLMIIYVRDTLNTVDYKQQNPSCMQFVETTSNTLTSCILDKFSQIADFVDEYRFYEWVHKVIGYNLYISD